MAKMQKLWNMVLNKATWGLISIGVGLQLIGSQSLPALGNLGVAGMIAGYTALGLGGLMVWDAVAKLLKGR